MGVGTQQTDFVELSGKMERIIDAADGCNDDRLRSANEAKDEWRSVNQNILKEGKATAYASLRPIPLADVVVCGRSCSSVAEGAACLSCRLKSYIIMM